MNDLVLSVGEFVAYLNQTLETAYPYVTIEGELSNFKVSRGRWVYFDLKDEEASVRFFGTVYALPGPLEDGMTVRVSGSPRLHPQFGFSVNFQQITPVGEGSIKKASDLLAKKLEAEGIFAPERKRPLPYPPARIALITAEGSAALADFIKILNARWQGVAVDFFDVQVQGDLAPEQIVRAINSANALQTPPEIIVLTRGGGSAEDLMAFSDERVVRAVAASRVPTLVAIGHEVDISLAELAADVRASTPSNAAEILTPDRREVLRSLKQIRGELNTKLIQSMKIKKAEVDRAKSELDKALRASFEASKSRLQVASRLLMAYDPNEALRRGYALIRIGGKVIKQSAALKPDDIVVLQFYDGNIAAKILHNIEKM